MLSIENIEYGWDIIVLIRFENHFEWYLSEKEYWLMDFSLEDDLASERFNIPILLNENLNIFRNEMKEFKVERKILKKLISINLPLPEWNEINHIFPSLYIDFTEQILYSYFPENTSFEEYVPKGWIGRHEPILEKIPLIERYWIINEVDYSSKYRLLLSQSKTKIVDRRVNNSKGRPHNI